MARRLISLEELDRLEGLLEQHRLLHERMETLERQAAQFDVMDPGVHELERRSQGLKRELTRLLEQLLDRVKS